MGFILMQKDAQNPAPDLIVQTMWPSTFFIRNWPLHEAEAESVSSYLRAVSRNFSGRAINSGTAQSAKSAAGLIESPMNLFEAADHPGLSRLISWFDESVRLAVHSVNDGRAPFDRLKTVFTESWFHITNDGGFHDAHYHSNCSWCGIYYLSAGQAAVSQNAAGNGINRFYAPLPVGGLISDYGNAYLLKNAVDIQPSSGKLLLFPSFLMHSALAYRGAEDRIVISFNSRTELT